MKTFVADDYEVSLNDDGSFKVRIIRALSPDTLITYSPKNEEEPWAIGSVIAVRAKSIKDLDLRPWTLKVLHKALEVIGKQDIMDNEIAFVSEKENPAAEKQTENDLELRLSPNITIQNGGLECIIEFGDRDFKFEFEQPISRIVQFAKSEKGCHKKENN